MRLRAGSEHGIVSPRLTQVNATIVEERDPYTQNGHGTANQSMTRTSKIRQCKSGRQRRRLLALALEVAVAAAKQPLEVVAVEARRQ